MHRFSDNKGMTLTELITAVFIFGLVGTCTCKILISALRCTDGTSTQTFIDQDAVSAMNQIVADIREAKTVTILNSGAKLSIIRPITTTAGYYDRHTADPNSEVQYYLSNNTGNAGVTGTWLWKLDKRVSATTPVVVKRNVSSLSFVQDTPKSIEVTVDISSVSGDNVNPTKLTELTQRVVYQRNY